MIAVFKKNIELHFFYWVSILLFIIVLLATKESTTEFTTYLGNTATMVSLVLGVVAIIYSFITTTGLEKSLGEITAVSKDFRESKGQIGEYLKLAEAQTEKIQVGREGLEHASIEVSTTISSLQETLGRVTDQNDNMWQIIQTFDGHFEEIGHGVNEIRNKVDAKVSSEKIATTGNNADRAPISDLLADEFLANSSIAGNLLTYSCVLADRTKKELSLLNLCKAIDLNLRGSMSGFLSCMKAVGLVKPASLQSKPWSYQITAVNPRLKAQTKHELNRFIATLAAEDRQIWNKRIEAIESLFDS